MRTRNFADVLRKQLSTDPELAAMVEEESVLSSHLQTIRKHLDDDFSMLALLEKHHPGLRDRFPDYPWDRVDEYIQAQEGE